MQIDNALQQIILPCLYSLIASIAFGVQFNIKLRHMIMAGIGGTLTQFIFLAFELSGTTEMLCYFFSAAAVSVYSEIMARVRKCPVTIFIICGILPLVPGGGMYYTMLASVEGNVTKSLNTGLSTLTIAGAIAVGVILVSSLTRLITFYYNKKSNCAKV